MTSYDIHNDYCGRCGAGYHEDYRALKMCNLCRRNICCYETMPNGERYCRTKCHRKILDLVEAKNHETLVKDKYDQLERMIRSNRSTVDILDLIEELKELTLISYSRPEPEGLDLDDPDCKVQ